MAKKGEIDLEELKKLTGKDSDYGAIKVLIEVGYEHLKYHSTGVPCFDKRIWEIGKMSLSQIDKELEKLRRRRRLRLKEGNNGRNG